VAVQGRQLEIGHVPEGGSDVTKLLFAALGDRCRLPFEHERARIARSGVGNELLGMRRESVDDGRVEQRAGAGT
jgi:hypothetical protein